MSNTVYRDGVKFPLDSGSQVKTKTTRDGHLVEYWASNGKNVYFVTLKNSVYCAHGDSLPEAIMSATWKDPTKRPDMKKLAKEIAADIENRKINVREFCYLTGACMAGTKQFLEQHNLPITVSMTIKEFKPIGGEWATKLEQVIQSEAGSL